MILAMGLRVLVKQDEHGIPLNATGTVARVRRDGSAFVALDQRSKVSRVHPFPEDDPRGTQVLALPDDCEMAQGNHKERRAAKKRADQPEATLENFGKDHWSTFAYINTLGFEGKPDLRRMRCNRKRHPLLAFYTGVPEIDRGEYRYPTRLKGGGLLHDHDDWDCVDDLERAGLVENVGTGVNPVLRVTEAGHRIWRAICEHKSRGGNLVDFDPATASTAAQ